MAGLAAAGAAAGTAIMPGIGTAVGGVLGAIGDMMGSGGSSGGSSSPQTAESAIYGDLGLDGSGWNVNFSGVQSNGSNKAAAGDLAGVVSSINPLWLAGGVLLLVVMWKKSSSHK